MLRGGVFWALMLTQAQLVLTAGLVVGACSNSHFTDMETEAQRGVS